MATELNQSFDELNYKINVEWDQKDETFLNSALDNFEKDIFNLQQRGLTNDELVKHTLAKIKDKATQTEISEIVKIIGDSKMSSEEARAFTIQRLNSTYSHGANWAGGKMVAHVALVLGVIAAIVLSALAFTDHHHHCDSQGDTGPQGPVGPEGPVGPTGPQGPVGIVD
jgi:hypothetical protein